MSVLANRDPKTRTDELRERNLLAVVRELVGELHPQRAKFIDVSPASRIERDLGIDSLGRTELALRIERALGLRLPIEVVGEADTLGDLLMALERASARRERAETKEMAAAALPRVSAPVDARTLPDVLDWHVAQHPDRLHVTVLQDHATVLGTMTYGELAKAARAVAAGLLDRDIAAGERVALMLPTGTDFFAAFFGVLHAGAVPVPIYPPSQLTQIEEHLRRQATILHNAGARILITVPQALRLGSLLRGLVATLDRVESVSSLTADSAQASLPALRDASATVLIQYTSGSTGDPKGVVLSHANVLANIRSFGRVINASSADVLVSWLPLYHDMGLIGAWLGCLYFGAPFYVMSPLAFLGRPQSWLWAIHRYRGTISAAPNFAFDLCATKIDEANLAGLDLDSLRFVANGSEPVNAHTMRRFIERFARYGFRPDAMAPAYGLAENAVALSMPPPGRPPIVDRVSREALSRHGVAEPASPDDPHAIEIVACGQPLPDHEIRIVDNSGREVDERREGRLEFRGPSATSGYFANERKTRELFHDGWLDSGDRAYMSGGDVFVTGRVKDIIIRAGQNLYPHEVEDAVAAVPGVYKAGVAVFGLVDPVFGTERVVVVAESEETDPAAKRALQAHAQEAATAIIGAPPDDVVLVRPGSVPKTSSGKLRRTAARELYLARGFDAGRRALRRQLLRLWLAGLGTRIAHAGRRLGETAYAAWWWVVLGISFAIGSLAIFALPRLAWRWAALRTVARAALAVMGMPLSVRGIERLREGNAVVVFNHSSYADALILASVLPDAPAFVAKREFVGEFFVGSALRRLGALFVERYDTVDSLADAKAVTAAAQSGRTVVFFPEGTFTRRVGLSAFYLGAFKVAAEANLPVYPGIIRGARSMLRSDQWFPRRVPISVEIEEAILPTGTDFASIVKLRDSVREVMLKKSGEPDLGELLKPAPPRAGA